MGHMSNSLILYLYQLKNSAILHTLFFSGVFYQLPDTAGSFWTKVGGECRRMEEPAGCAMPTRLNGTQE